MKSRYAFLLVALLLALLTAIPTTAQDNDTHWVYAKIEVNVTTHTQGEDKHQFRVYVSNLISVTTDQWVELLQYHAKQNVSKYFDETVGKAAASKGEEFSYYDQDIEYDCTCVGTANEERLKSDVEEKRNQDIEAVKENGHPVVLFNWDPTGKKKDEDLKSEMQKLNSPPAKPAIPAKPVRKGIRK